MLSSPWQRQTDRQRSSGPSVAAKESNRDTLKTDRRCIVKGLGQEKDFKKFDKNGQIYRPKEGAQKILIFSGVPLILYQK